MPASSWLLCRAPEANAWQAGSIANLHEFATATSSYAADNSNLFWSFSWQTGVPTPSQYPDLQAPPGDAFAAAAAQAVDILRAGARNRPDMPVISNWAAPIFYHMLPLADYLDAPLPLRFAVSPGDKNRLLWSNDIAGFDQGAYLPTSPDPSDPLNFRWPYSSSYRVPAAFCSPDAVTTASGTIVPAGDAGIYMTTFPTFNIGNRHITEVTFPSQKVQVFDNAQWQGAATPVFAAYSFARVPMLMVDGSARVRATGQANPGFNPNNPRSPFPTTLSYSPQPWEPPTINGQSSLTMRYFWTRAGIRGRDYEGDETDTSNW